MVYTEDRSLQDFLNDMKLANDDRGEDTILRNNNTCTRASKSLSTCCQLSKRRDLLIWIWTFFQLPKTLELTAFKLNNLTRAYYLVSPSEVFVTGCQSTFSRQGRHEFQLITLAWNCPSIVWVENGPPVSFLEMY